MKDRIKNWVVKSAQKKTAMYILAAVAFFESIIFPVPVDVFTFTMALAQPEKWWRFALNATIFSVLGAIVGYVLGAELFDVFGQRMIDAYGYQDEFDQVVSLFQGNVFWVVFVSAFTPIPYKVFTVTGGALGIAFIPFILASIIGRGLRFAIGAYIPARFGKKVGNHILKNFNTYSLLVGVLVILYVVYRQFFM